MVFILKLFALWILFAWGLDRDDLTFNKKFKNQIVLLGIISNSGLTGFITDYIYIYINTSSEDDFIDMKFEIFKRSGFYMWNIKPSSRRVGLSGLETESHSDVEADSIN